MTIEALTVTTNESNTRVCIAASELVGARILVLTHVTEKTSTMLNDPMGIVPHIIPPFFIPFIGWFNHAITAVIQILYSSIIGPINSTDNTNIIVHPTMTRSVT